MNQDAQQATPTVPFLRGSFQAFSLAEVFGVLALSRQLVGLRFSDQETEVGAIVVKAGHVVGAEDFRTRAKGADALTALVTNPGTDFAVVMLARSASEWSSPEVVGKLAELLPEQGELRGNMPEASPPEPPAAEMGVSSSLTDVFDAAELPPLSSSAPTSRDGEVVMRGDFSDVEFDEVLEVLQLSEQPLLISFIRDDWQVGTLNLMSEQVLAAGAGSLRGMEAFRRLYADHGETFEVRRVAALDATEALGGVSELLAEMHRVPPPSPAAPRSMPQAERVLFMQGRLSDFPLGLLIGSLDLSRQPIELVLRRDETILHQVQVKSGRITDAGSASGEGVDAALTAIREDPGDEFLVYRCKELPDRPPVAPLEALVSELAGPVARSAAPMREEQEAADDRLSDINGLLETIAVDLAALRATLETSRQDPTRAGSADTSREAARYAAGQAKPPIDPGRSQESATMEVRSVLDTLRQRRQDRVLLWCIVALQLGCLAVAVALLVHATGPSFEAPFLP